MVRFSYVVFSFYLEMIYFLLIFFIYIKEIKNLMNLVGNILSCYKLGKIFNEYISVDDLIKFRFCFFCISIFLIVVLK